MISYLLDVLDVVSIQYQDEDKADSGVQNVSLQVRLPTYQNITEETVIEAQSAESNMGSKDQRTQEQESERPYVTKHKANVVQKSDFL